MIHKLKTWRGYFEDVEKGIKTFELRKNDRGFVVGDILLLQEWNKNKEEYTGNELRFKISYILHGGSFGLDEGFCIMSLAELGRCFP